MINTPSEFTTHTDPLLRHEMTFLEPYNKVNICIEHVSPLNSLDSWYISQESKTNIFSLSIETTIYQHSHCL